MEKKYLILSLCLSFILCCILPAKVYAQQTQTFNGTIVDEKGEPIVGASVKIEGTTTGTLTDIDGKFSISVPSKGKVTIAFIGYITQTITDFKNTRIVMEEDMMKLDEVVVVGYGTQKMKNVTGAISTIAPEEFTDLSSGNLAASLGGLVTGVNISGGNNRPGEQASMSVRQTSVLSSFSSVSGYVPETSPLYVIDDRMATEDEFNRLNANDIESVSVLKDASAAIYGVYGARGAVLIKTKRGQIGAPKISYQGQFGYADEVSRPKMLNSYDYGVLWNATIAAKTSSNVIDPAKDLFQYQELEAMKKLNYDLLDREWSAAFTQRHSINVSGGSERATYFASVAYFSQDGNLGKIDYDRWNYRAGVDAKISKWLKASVQVSGDYGKQNTALNKIGGSNGETDYNVLLTHPRYMPDYVNGLPVVAYGVSNTAINSIQNYHFDALQQSKNYKENSPQNMNINTSVEYDFGWSDIFKGLKFKVAYSKNIGTTKSNELATDYVLYKMINRGTGGLGSSSNGHLYTGDDVDMSMSNFEAIKVSSAGTNESYLSRNMSRYDGFQINATISYDRKFGLHNVSGLFSIERSENESEDLKGQVNKPMSFTDGQSASAQGTQTTTFGRTENALLSYIGRANYSYADRYLLEFLIRIDASTKFAPENYWGTFPSVSAGWVMSEESWFKNNIKGIDFFKLRGSFGLTGKDNIKPWEWLQLYGIGSNKGPIFGTNPNNPLGSAISSREAPNRYAKWDKTYKTNFGIDLRTLSGRLSVNLDGYYEMARDVFMTRQGAADYPSTVGTRPAAENYGSIDAYGLEVSLGWRDKIANEINYYVRLNTGYSDNKIKDKPWPAKIPIDQVHPNHRSDTGEWGLECIGMFRSYQEIEEYFNKYNITNYLGNTKENVHPGMLIYRDIRGQQNEDGSYNGPDGVVDLQNDIVRISNRSNPYGFTVNFGGNWKGLSLSAQINANWGGYSFIPKSARGIQNLTSSGGNYKDMEFTNLPSFWANDMFIYEDVYDANGNIVAAKNHDAKYPNMRYKINMETSTFWKVSGTRVTLRNITLAYSLPKELIRKVGLSSCRFNLTGQNMLSFYNPYPDNFIDPLSGNYGSYPTLRRLTLGVNVSF